MSGVPRFFLVVSVCYVAHLHHNTPTQTRRHTSVAVANDNPVRDGEDAHFFKLNGKKNKSLLFTECSCWFDSGVPEFNANQTGERLGSSGSG